MKPDLVDVRGVAAGHGQQKRRTPARAGKPQAAPFDGPQLGVLRAKRDNLPRDGTLGPVRVVTAHEGDGHRLCRRRLLGSLEVWKFGGLVLRRGVAPRTFISLETLGVLWGPCLGRRWRRERYGGKERNQQKEAGAHPPPPLVRASKPARFHLCPSPVRALPNIQASKLPINSRAGRARPGVESGRHENPRRRAGSRGAQAQNRIGPSGRSTTGPCCRRRR